MTPHEQTYLERSDSAYFGHGGSEGHVVAAGFGNVCQHREMPTKRFVLKKSTGSPVQPRTMPS